MTIDKLINVLVMITLFEMMVAIGLGVRFRAVLDVARNWRLIARAALANYIVVPATAVGLLLLFDAHPMIAAGFVVAAVCPGAPYGPLFTAIARGDVPVAVGLMVVLAGSSALISPALLYVLLPHFSGNESLEIAPGGLIATLLVTQLLPLLAGLLTREFRPALADKLKKPFDKGSKILNLVAFALILYAQFHTLKQIKLTGFFGMLTLFVVSGATGWLLGGPGTGSRKALAQTTTLRNAGLSMVIASGSFAGTPALPAVVAYAVVSIGGALLLALGWGKQAQATKGTEG